jgi:hypothetical protein
MTIRLTVLALVLSTLAISRADIQWGPCDSTRMHIQEPKECQDEWARHRREQERQRPNREEQTPTAPSHELGRRHRP